MPADVENGDRAEAGGGDRRRGRCLRGHCRDGGWPDLSVLPGGDATGLVESPCARVARGPARSYHVAATPWHHSYVWQTTNTLLGSYRGMLGIKTGNTNAAGNCFLFEARRGRRTLVGVVLHVNPTRNGNALFTAARRLLNWGFRRM